MLDSLEKIDYQMGQGQLLSSRRMYTISTDGKSLWISTGDNEELFIDNDIIDSIQLSFYWDKLDYVRVP